MTKPDFLFEKKCWREGYDHVLGLDEVGRGALAGPVIAAVCSLKVCHPSDHLLKSIVKLGINDSKKLSSDKRKDLSTIIPQYFHIGIAQASVGEVNRLGIVGATNRAMRRAVAEIFSQSRKRLMYKAFILIDGFPLKYVPFLGQRNQKAIIKGDEKSVSIASASIMAKVYRDHLMIELSGKFPRYSWDRNMGYGTRLHIQAIKKFGLTRWHRHKFVDGL